ncbi:MAG: cytochrome b/b6 domain-containing protein [Bacteroidota bacterium]|nr:cytochrome b/b6 domain-containing protein [Bacteroidota bacterium]
MQNKNYTTVYRIMHWAIATCMILMLITIFLRLTWMNKDHMAGIIKTYLSTTDQSLSQDQLIVLAKQIRKPMWNWHIYIGYVLVGLYCIRLALPFFGQMKFSNPFNKLLTLKEKFRYWVYLVFYGCVAVSLTTGLIIEFGPKNLKKSMEEIHVLSIYYLLAFICIHIGGVLIGEFTDQQGIVSKIISGTKKTEEK